MIYERIILFLFLFTCVNSFTIYNVRLGSSSTLPAHSGRVEVLTQRGWLPICVYFWSSSESRVVCRQLGYAYSSYSRSSPSSVSSLEYYFYCSGTESSLLQCSYSFNNEYQSSCSYINTVTCVPCVSGSIQIRGGDEAEQGIVEYCSSGLWKAVCGSSWTNLNSFVVCRQLGFPATGAIAYHFGIHPFPSGISFSCFGNESSLSSCRSSSSSSCRIYNTAGVHCRGEIITSLCVNGHFRLTGGENSNEGRVEICSNGVWGTVWSGEWDSNDATVFCRQLGLYQPYSRVEVFRYNQYFGAGTGPIVYTYLRCDGTESRLENCRTSNSFYFSASHSNDAGVRCQRPVTTARSSCMNGDVRLVNSTTAYEGRVEICYDGVWGSVCDSSWNDRDAAIVCQQMGFQGTNATALLNSHFGDGEGPYHLSGLSCRGDERTLLNCPRSPSSSTIGYHTCSPGNDAGARCDASICGHGDVRLFGGYTPRYGIAEVCINGHWADICSTGSSSSPNTIASTFCRQLTGQQSISVGIQSCCSGIRRRNTGNLTLYSISCSGQSGTFIQDCSYSIIPGYSAGSCNLQREMIVGCYESANCNAGDVRLMDGNSTLEGRVEVCTQGLWGAISVYRSSNPSNDARVICRQLGFPWEWALILTNNLFGQGSSRIVARRIRCTGAEAQLSSCSNSTVSLSSGASYQWPGYNPAGVICQGLNTSRRMECNSGDVRLASGSRETEGRVEVCAYGYWAIACDNNWNNAATHLVCKQLGFPTETSEYLLGSPFGSNYLLPLVGLYCSSGARNISQCQLYNRTSCNHRRSVGVFCKGHREYYKVEIHISPTQESYEVGSLLTFNCTVTPSPQNYENFTFPLRYLWSFPDRGFIYSSTSSTTITISPYETSFGDCYCLIYRYSTSGLFLGRERIPITTKSILESNSNMSGPIKIQVRNNQETITLQIYNTSNHDVVNQLMKLTWYHNESKIIPSNDPRLSLSSNNMTLTITNFTSSLFGVYRAQFDQLPVPSSDENNLCEAEVLSLTRNYPILKPVIFCVNVDDCSDSNIETQIRQISIRSLDPDTQGTLTNITLEADATVLSHKELQHSSIYWNRNGIGISGTSSLQRRYNTLSLSQRFQQLSASYELSGRYEVQLRINMNTYLRAGDSTCLPYYNSFVSRYLGSTVILAKGYIDIDYYKNLTFDLDVDKIATTRDEGATLTCRASIEFPPFSMLSLIKNGQMVATSINSSLQINARSINTNQFGLYICQLNASGATFRRSYTLKEKANFRMILEIKNSNICGNSEMAVRHIEKTLIQKIKRECQCSFNRDGFQNSTINCESSSELVYKTTLEYSDEEGSETASVIAGRIIGQVPFSMAVGGTQLTVKNACTNCEMPSTKVATSSLTPVIGSGLFIGGFLAAVLITIILMMIVILAVRRCAKSEDKDGRRVEVNTDPLRYTSTRAAHQDVPLKGTAAEYMTPQPKKQSEYQAMGPRDQPSQYETMQFGDQPIYEETF